MGAIFRVLGAMSDTVGSVARRLCVMTGEVGVGPDGVWHDDRKIH